MPEPNTTMSSRSRIDFDYEIVDQYASCMSHKIQLGKTELPQMRGQLGLAVGVVVETVPVVDWNYREKMHKDGSRSQAKRHDKRRVSLRR